MNNDKITPFKDSAGNIICLGDILRVYHFTGVNGRRYYMYKQVEALGKFTSGNQFLEIHHLPVGKGLGSYAASDLVLDDCVVVQRGYFFDSKLDDLKKNPKMRD